MICEIFRAITPIRITQTVEVPIYDDFYKEGDEIFWFIPVSTGEYSGNKGVNNIDFKRGEVV